MSTEPWAYHIAVRVVAVELDIVDRVGEAADIQAQTVLEQAALDAGFPGQDGFRIGSGEIGIEHCAAALDGGAAEAARNACIHTQLRIDLIHRAQIPAGLGIGHAHIAPAAVGHHTGRGIGGLEQAGLLGVLGLADAGSQRQRVGRLVAELTEAGPRGIGIAQAHPVVRVARGGLQEIGTLIEIGDVAAVEIERAHLPLQGVVAFAGQAQFLRVLVQVADLPHRLAKAVRHAIDRVIGGSTAIGVATAVAGSGFVGGDGGQRHATEVVNRLERAAIGLIRLRVVVPFVVGHAVARHVHLVAATRDRVAQEQGGRAVVIARVHRAQQRERIVGLERDLQARIAVVVTAHRVLARRARAVGAATGKGVVHPIVAVLVQRGHTERQHIVDGATEAAIQRESVVAAVAGVDATGVGVAGLDRIELDDAGGGVAPEQRALRAAQHFDLVHVIDRIGFEHDMLQHHIVLDDGHRLRGTQVEIDIAQATDIEAREDAPGGGFGVEARYAAGKRQQRVVATGGVVAHRCALHHADRDRHVLQVLLAVLGSDGDRVQRGGAGFALGRRRLLRRRGCRQRG